MRSFFFILCAAISALHAADKPFTMPGLKQDIEFAKAGDVSLTLDALVPEGAGPFATCIHGMGGWETLGSDYQAQMIAWLRKTLK